MKYNGKEQFYSNNIFILLVVLLFIFLGVNIYFGALMMHYRDEYMNQKNYNDMRERVWNEKNHKENDIENVPKSVA